MGKGATRKPATIDNDVGHGTLYGPRTTAKEGGTPRKVSKPLAER